MSIAKPNSDTMERLETATDVLSTACDGVGDWNTHGGEIISRLHEQAHEKAPNIFQPKVHMFLLRYGSNPEDTMQRLQEECEDEIGEVDEDVIREMVEIIGEYAREDSVIQEAVKETLTEVAPLKGHVYHQILDAYSENPETVREELPDQQVLDKEVPSTHPISIEEVAAEYEIEMAPDNIELLAKCVITEHFRTEEVLRETMFEGEEDVDRMDSMTQEFVAMIDEVVSEYAPYEYDEKEFTQMMNNLPSRVEE